MFSLTPKHLKELFAAGGRLFSLVFDTQKNPAFKRLISKRIVMWNVFLLLMGNWKKYWNCLSSFFTSMHDRSLKMVAMIISFPANGAMPDGEGT